MSIYSVAVCMHACERLQRGIFFDARTLASMHVSFASSRPVANLVVTYRYEGLSTLYMMLYMYARNRNNLTCQTCLRGLPWFMHGDTIV